MKNSPLNAILLGVLTLSALASVFWCFSYLMDSRAMRTYQVETAMINNHRARITAMVQEAAAYSQKNPAILPVLQRLGIRVNVQPVGAAQTNKPAR